MDRALEWLRTAEVSASPAFHLTLTRWEGGKRWLAVECNGSCLSEFPERNLKEANSFFDGVLCGLKVALEEAHGG